MKNISCDTLHVENGTVLSCEAVESGEFKMNDSVTFTGLPKFYRIRVKIEPVPRSSILVELWLPEDGVWNGRFLGTGNAGGGARIYYYQLRYGLMRGFAAANVDMGTSPNADKATREGQIDFGYRATHVMAVVSKSIIEQVYGRAAGHSYFIGGSTGGHQALSEAQRYPEDFDGIVAGCPGNDCTHLHAQFVWNLQAAKTDDGSLMFTQ